jgi:hypothetical protein
MLILVEIMWFTKLYNYFVVPINLTMYNETNNVGKLQ